MPQATIKLKYSFLPSFLPPTPSLLHSLLQNILTNSKLYFSQVPLGKFMSVQCCFRWEMAACRMPAGPQHEMLPRADTRYGQSAVPAGFLEAWQSRLPLANAEDPWQTQAQKTPGGPAFPSRNITVLTLHLFPIIRCEIRLCPYPFSPY